jgi:hypothetical protein
MRIVDMRGVLEFYVEVVLPTIIDRSIGNAGSTELGGEGNAGAIKRERVMGEGYAVESHEADKDEGGQRELGLDAVLKIASEAKEGNHQQRKKIAVTQVETRGAGNEEQQIGYSKRSD